MGFSSTTFESKTASGKIPSSGSKSASREIFSSNRKFTYKIERNPLKTQQDELVCTYKTASGRGTWPSRDPIEEWGGINLYAFVENDPIGRWDRLGLLGFWDYVSAVGRGVVDGAGRLVGAAQAQADTVITTAFALAGHEGAHNELVNSQQTQRIIDAAGGDSSLADISRAVVAEATGGLQAAELYTGREIGTQRQLSDEEMVEGYFNLIARLSGTAAGTMIPRSIRRPKVCPDETTKQLPLSEPRGNRNNAPDYEQIVVDPNGNAIPLGEGEYLTGSPDGRFIQVRGADGTPTGLRIDGPHSPASHTDPRALRPHAHVPGVTNSDGTPWLPIR